jgi:folate-binding protein YgfZ
MSSATIALLPDRGVVRVAGEDAGKLLQGVVTNDMDVLATAPALHAGLLSPQGKILFDFFVYRAPEGFLVETARAMAADLVRRLSMYKLRAKVAIEDTSSDFTVAVLWGGALAASASDRPGPLVAPDPRHPDLGLRLLLSLSSDWVLAESGATPAPQEEYHAHRIALGVPEAGRDFVLGDTFPHEALYDQLNGLSFAKGCYVGQEVVSRMQHRGTARRRVLIASAESELPAFGAEILADGRSIGTLCSVAGRSALAIVRIDKVKAAMDDGVPILADGVALSLAIPEWAKFSFSQETAVAGDA